MSQDKDTHIDSKYITFDVSGTIYKIEREVLSYETTKHKPKNEIVDDPMVINEGMTEILSSISNGLKNRQETLLDILCSKDNSLYTEVDGNGVYRLSRDPDVFALVVYILRDQINPSTNMLATMNKFISTMSVPKIIVLKEELEFYCLPSIVTQVCVSIIESNQTLQQQWTLNQKSLTIDKNGMRIETYHVDTDKNGNRWHIWNDPVTDTERTYPKCSLVAPTVPIDVLGINSAPTRIFVYNEASGYEIGFINEKMDSQSTIRVEYGTTTQMTRTSARTVPMLSVHITNNNILTMEYELTHQTWVSNMMKGKYMACVEYRPQSKEFWLLHAFDGESICIARGISFVPEQKWFMGLCLRPHRKEVEPIYYHYAYQLAQYILLNFNDPWASMCRENIATVQRACKLSCPPNWSWRDVIKEWITRIILRDNIYQLSQENYRKIVNEVEDALKTVIQQENDQRRTSSNGKSDPKKSEGPTDQ
jgi:hypothetical protein